MAAPGRSPHPTAGDPAPGPTRLDKAFGLLAVAWEHLQPVLEGFALAVAMLASTILFMLGLLGVVLFAAGRDVARAVRTWTPRAARQLGDRGQVSLARTRHELAAVFHRGRDLRPDVLVGEQPVGPPPPGRMRLGRRLLVSAAVTAVLWQATSAGLATRVPIDAMGVAVGVSSGDATLPPLEQRSVLYATDGNPLVTVHAADANRAAVPLDAVSPTLVHAVIDTEDDRYWDHGGIDVKGIVRAATSNLLHRGVTQGGSTITQQLVKTTLLSPERNLTRKLREIVLADRLQARVGKRAVLERYLNTVYLGEGAYGVEAAAQGYFAKSASQVTVPEAALIAGLIQGPGDFDPIRHPAAAKARRRHVLERMVANGHLSRAAAQQADDAPLPAAMHRPNTQRDYATTAVIDELLRDPRLGATVAERRHRVFQGGLRVHTTIDARTEMLATAAVRDGVPGGNGLSGALAAVDPTTGAVRALVGGLDFARSQYDASQGVGRQTGSSFKVFALVAALEKGRSPGFQLDGSSPCPIPNPAGTPNPWKPGNYEGEAFGRITLTSATVHSVNCAYARLAHEIGLDTVAKTARKMGVTAPLEKVPSLALGSNPVPPLQMASAYATLAADGVYHRPHLVDHVDDPSGRRLLTNRTEGRRVLDPDVARNATAILEKVVDDGTGKAADVKGRDVAGKTGTADDSRDTWFVGYTPQLATAVWMGHPDAEVPVTIGGKAVVGGSYPARMWSRFMTAALSGSPVARFAPPTKAPADDKGASDSGGSPGSSADSQPGQSWCWTSCGHSGPPPPDYVAHWQQNG